MDLLEIMELLNNNNTSSPSISVNINTTNSDSLYQITMESNNLDQDAGGGDASVGEGIAEQPPLEGTLSPSLLPRLELKLPILSSSSSESESEEAANPTAGTSAETSGERVASPPPNCAICLGRCKNKCFTDSCMHQFCFKCLCEWSKVKPECPLCKQTFKSIIHNVKSIDQFEEYHVQPPTVQIAHSQFEMDFPQMRIFGVVHQNLGRNEAWNDRVHRPLFIYPGSASNAAGSTSGAVTAGGSSSRSTPIGSLRNQYVYRGELLDLYRQEYPDAIASNSTLSQLWRRYVYDRKLYALPVCDITGRFRESSAQYYRDNPAQIHRLVSWINRDLHCLLRQTQHDFTTVLDSINTALSLMNILSPAFRRRLQSYLGNKTAHFIHELNNFARSPYDMIGYDRVVEYSPQSNEDVIIEFTSSDDSTDNDDIDVADDSALPMPSSASINAINLTIHNRLTSNAGRGGDGAASTSGSTRSVVQDGVSLVIDLRGDVEEPAGSDAAARANQEEGAPPAQPANNVAENIELTSGSSDECEFVLERKPPHLRTPEMVSLDSASDSDVVFVDESKPLSKTTFSTSEGEQDDEATGRLKRPTTSSMITALVEAKKRSQQSANSVKSESQGASEVYNVGASTSAALRLSIQQRSDRSRLRRSKYSLRNIRAETDQNQPKRRGKRLPSESSHSSSSRASLTASASSTNASNSGSDELATSSDEEYVASTAQKRNVNQRKRRRIKKTSKSKCSSTSKSDSRKRRKTNNDDSTCDEEDNGHMGKNFALVMAIGERLKRQKEKLKKSHAANVSDEEDHSDGENSWRLKAVNEPLRKQQQQNAKVAIKSNERKRRVRKSPQKLNEGTEQSEPDHCERTAIESHEGEVTTYKTCETSSDESDNLKLIELKTKLTRKCSNESLEETTNSNRLQEEDQTDAKASNGESQTENGKETVSTACNEQTPLPEEPLTSPNDTNCDNSNMPNIMQDDDMHSSSDEDDRDCHEADHVNDQNDKEHDGEDNGGEHVDSYHAEEEEQDGDDGDHMDNEYSNETTNLPSPMEQGEEEPEDEEEEGSDATLNIPTSMNLSHESNVFCGASMSTTTTDTILNEAAEQISSAAVNFYNPQQAFNTAVFADDNTSNSSSSSESSVSSTTTTSSSNSSSSNTNGFMNYDLS